MSQLPIPPLKQTLDTLIQTVNPLLTAKELAHSQQLSSTFEHGTGQEAQRSLQDFANQQHLLGKSWLSDDWLNSYLCERRPLNLSSNVAFEINWPAFENPLDKAVDLIIRQAQLHIDYINNKISPLTDARGTPLCMQQWSVLRGTIRHPKKHRDEIYYASADTKNRHISLFWKNHHIILPVTDEHGRLYSRTVIKNVLEDILHNIHQPNETPFTDISTLGSDTLHIHLEEMLKNSASQKVYQALCDSWFAVSLFHDKESNNETLLEKLTFNPPQCWQYKTINFQMNLETGYLGVNIEHSIIDGGSLLSILERSLSRTFEDTDFSDTRPEWKIANWTIAPHNYNPLKKKLKEVEELADRYQLSFCNIDFSSLKNSGKKISHDALQQFALSYAQLKTFACIRNTYEAVDMRNFMAGRTEALRPVTEQAIELCEALLLDKATPDLLNAALAAHKQRVIACKTGQAIDRHLLGLRWQCPDDDFFNTPAIRVLETDFLSTSSMGNQKIIRYFAFPPTSADGFGVNYSQSENHYHFCISAQKDRQPELKSFSYAVAEGAEKLITLAVLLSTV